MRTLSICLIVFLAACSTKPKLMPNDHLLAVNIEQVNKDIAECQALADLYADDNEEWGRIAKDTAKASVIGTAAGAVGGAIVHSAGRGAAIGAAGAAVASILNGLFSLGENSPSTKRFTNYCLAKRGYEVAG